jgi:hypothetical protein
MWGKYKQAEFSWLRVEVETICCESAGEQVQEESEKALTKSFGKWEHEQRMKERERKREELMQTLGEDTSESLKKMMQPHDTKVRVLQGRVALRLLFQRIEVGDDECGGLRRAGGARWWPHGACGA